MQRRLVHRTPDIPLRPVRLRLPLRLSSVILQIRRSAFLRSAVMRAEDIRLGCLGGPRAAACRVRV